MQEEEKQNGSSGTPSEQPKKHKKEKGKSLIETMREIDAKEAQKEAEAEERRQEILAEREKKEKEAYAKKIQQDRIELMRLKQGIITESDTIYEEKEEKPKLPFGKTSPTFYTTTSGGWGSLSLLQVFSCSSLWILSPKSARI